MMSSVPFIVIVIAHLNVVNADIVKGVLLGAMVAKKPHNGKMILMPIEVSQSNGVNGEESSGQENQSENGYDNGGQTEQMGYNGINNNRQQGMKDPSMMMMMPIMNKVHKPNKQMMNNNMKGNSMCDQMNGQKRDNSMYGQKNENLMYGQMTGQMYGLKSDNLMIGQMNGQKSDNSMYGQMNGQKSDNLMYGQMTSQMNGQMYGQKNDNLMYGQINGQKCDHSMYGQMNVQMYGQMNGRPMNGPPLYRERNQQNGQSYNQQQMNQYDGNEEQSFDLMMNSLYDDEQTLANDQSLSIEQNNFDKKVRMNKDRNRHLYKNGKNGNKLAKQSWFNGQNHRLMNKMDNFHHI